MTESLTVTLHDLAGRELFRKTLTPERR